VRGYRKNLRSLPGKPDVVFGRGKLAVLVHGCFWHRCPTCTRNLNPKRNGAYWEAKFQRNVRRDAENVRALEALGYAVLVIWECRLRADVNGVVREVVNRLIERRSDESSQSAT
jgi:DNA mismatch endonuclease (patch repair protein)